MTVVVSVHQWDPGSILWRASFFFSSPLSPRLAFLFLPPFYLSSNFFLPFPPAFLPFFLSTILFPFVFFLFLLLVSPFCSFSFSLSSLYFIFLISSSFSSPLSFSFFFFLCSHKMTTFCGLYIAMTDQTGF